MFEIYFFGIISIIWGFWLYVVEMGRWLGFQEDVQVLSRDKEEGDRRRGFFGEGDVKFNFGLVEFEVFVEWVVERKSRYQQLMQGFEVEEREVRLEYSC